MDYNTITEAQWEALPLALSEAERKADRWRPLMDALEEGKIVSLPFMDRRDLRSKKVVVARLAGRAGFTVQARQDDGHVAFRRMDVSVMCAPGSTR
jgi:hypothetical protein